MLVILGHCLGGVNQTVDILGGPLKHGKAKLTNTVGGNRLKTAAFQAGNSVQSTDTYILNTVRVVEGRVSGLRMARGGTGNGMALDRKEE